VRHDGDNAGGASACRWPARSGARSISFRVLTRAQETRIVDPVQQVDASRGHASGGPVESDQSTRDRGEVPACAASTSSARASRRRHGVARVSGYSLPSALTENEMTCHNFFLG
jgi:hypothetical protein